ncbi:MAG TPA: acyclic terpene utilization AtuA family protein [Xanthobacteraceae bacterium]|nr:acyclic terpene utilization AtuA family protein [Xanthobacteraceae bacterium]
MREKIRIAAGQGFWGDLPDAPVRQVEGGPIDYLMLDYLAEVTMSILQKQKARDPNAGYARDFVPLMKQILPACVERNIRVTANAGGVNVEGCAKAVRDVAIELGLAGKLRIGIVTGDDIMGKLDELLSRGVELRNMDTGAGLSNVRERIQSANVYLGAAPMVEALDRGAQIVITGRATDTGLTLAPLMHEFGWAPDDWNRMAAGTIAGHIIECGAQCTGGNCQYEWRSIPSLANVGFPIVEAAPDGTFVVTKHEGTGGWVIIPSIKEQLVYEMGDPHSYITPDCSADFTTVRLEYEGRDRVRVFGIEGRPATDTFKVSISYSAGYKAVGTLVYSWPEAYDKARAADRILRARLDRLGLKFDQILTEFVGANATHGPLAGEPPADLPEVQLRVGVRSENRSAVEKFTKEIAPLVLTGPPGVTGFAGGRPKVEEIVAYWPALIPKSEITSHVEVIEV